MKNLPLIPQNFMNVPIVISIVDGMNESGTPKVISTHSVKCYYEEKRKLIFEPDGKKIQLAGIAIIGGDIAEANKLEGFVTIFSEEYKIYKGSRLRGYDGSVHHLELELV